MTKLRISVMRITSVPQMDEPLLLTPITDDLSSNKQTPAIHKGTQYLWAIYGGFRLPILSGVAGNKREVERIAEQYGLNSDIDYKIRNNEDLVELVRSEHPVASYLKRQSGKYTLATWNSSLDYLIGLDPVVFEDYHSEQSLSDAIAYYGDGNQYASLGEFITNYIRRKEALRKFSTPSNSLTTGKIEFVYANHNEGSYRADWKRHRIIKQTDQTLFVDRYPFCGKSYLRNGWQAMVVYAAMLDRAAMEKEQRFYHGTHRMHFYTDRQARKRCRRHFIKGGAFTEEVLELPKDDIGWALKLLGVAPWPAIAADIKKAFSRAAMIHHPDRGGTHQMFIDCMVAKEFLMDQVAD